MMKDIVILVFFLSLLGFEPSDAQNENPKSLRHSWETQKFLNKDILIEQESENQFFALRERRDIPALNGNDPQNGESGCGSVDPCVDGMNNCDDNAECNGTTDGYTCTCKMGFSGNGQSCADINECEFASTHSCSMNAKCNNTFGSYDCTCNETFYGDGRVCTELRSDFSSKNVYAKLGERAILVCMLNETVVWKKGGQLITEDQRKVVRQNILIVSPRDNEDYGEYFCELQKFKGIGIKMYLVRIEASQSRSTGDDPDELIAPVVILSILLGISLVIIGYLLFSRRKLRLKSLDQVVGAKANDYVEDNDVYDMMEIPSSSLGQGDQVQESHYAALKTTPKEESIYQGLVTEIENRDNDAPLNQARDLYEPVNLGLK